MAKSDLISRKALLKDLREELKECRKDADEFGGENVLWAEGIEFAIDAVKQTRAVDAVEVVRCKDCEYYEGDECVNPYIFMSDGAHLYTNPDDFCSYGEGREGE